MVLEREGGRGRERLRDREGDRFVTSRVVFCCPGTERFFDDIELMLGKRPGKIWSISWKFVAPIALAVSTFDGCDDDDDDDDGLDSV